MPDARAFGHLRPPTAAQLDEYARRHGMTLSTDEANVLLGAVSGALAALDSLDGLDSSQPELRHRQRDPGRRPRPDEDPLNAFIRFCDVAGAEEGPLAGITVAVKDCISVAGVPTTDGARRRPHHVPVEDAVVVERILDAGARIIGKTNLEDLALGYGETSHFGAARNPIDPALSSGGSSSGSAVAVATGMADMALGGDQAGSIRIPAAWCGIVGMKATHGLVPTYGLTHMDHTIDHIGPMTTTVRDNARLLEVIAGADERDPQWVRDVPTPPRWTEVLDDGVDGMRVGIVGGALGPTGCTPEVAEAFEAALDALRRAGAVVGRCEVPLWPAAFALELAVLAHGLYGMHTSSGQGYGHLGRVEVEAVAAAAARSDKQADLLPPFLKLALLTVEHVRELYGGVPLAEAHNLRLELRRQVDETFGAFDVLVTPTTPGPPFELATGPLGFGAVLERVGAVNASANTCPLDLTGHPAISVPAPVDEGRLPVGFQIIGRRFGEGLVYRAAQVVEVG